MPLVQSIFSTERAEFRARIAQAGGLVAVLILGLGLLPKAMAASTNDEPAELQQGTNVVTHAGLDPTYSLGAWIWAEETYDKQMCRLWKTFEIPHNATVMKAKLRITADNGYRLFLDGREIGRGSDWRSLTEYDLTWVLFPGTHVLAVEGFNDRLEAGVILGMRIEFTEEPAMEVASDESWRVVPETERAWERRITPRKSWRSVRVVGALGAHPWWSKPAPAAPEPPLRPIILSFWQTGWFQVVMLTTCGIVVLICLRLTAQLALQSKAQRLLQLERARIARDIHDDLGAGLTQLVVLGEVAQSELARDSETRTQINQLCEKARDLSHSMDEIVWAVNSRRDTLRDFASYVCKHAQIFLHSTPIRCRLDVEPELPTLPFDLPIRRNLFLAVKEALNNAAKYSEASELYLRVHRQGQGLLVMVDDNGRGFDPELINPERNGLTNMKQRMAEVGGTFSITSRPGEGCRIEFHVPLLQARQKPRWLERLFQFPARRKAPAEKSAAVAPASAPATTKSSA